MPTCCIDNICRVICDATFEPVLVCDDWRPLACNTRLLEVFNYTNESEVTTQPIREIINQHFTPKEVTRNGLTQPTHILELTYAKVTKSDMSAKMAIVKTKKWEFENRTYYTVSIRDVPILKLADDKIEKQKEGLETDMENKSPKEVGEHNSMDEEPELESRLLAEFALLADAIPVMIFFCGREGEIYYANKRVKEVWGEDVLSSPWADYVHPEDWERFVPLWKNAYLTSTSFKMESRYRNKHAQPISGDQYEWRWHIFQSVPVFAPNGFLKRWVITAVDVHDWKSAEAEKQHLIASEKMAIEASQLKSAFLSTMSHEIRTPLFGIVGNTCLLKETNINDDQQSFIDTIDGSARLMMSVIQDILDFSRIEAGKLNLSPTKFSFNRVIDRISKMVSASCNKKGLGFNLRGLKEDLFFVADKDRFQQIIINLASNAIKFTHRGFVTFDISSHLLSTNEVALRLSFTDTGIGMGKDVISKLFTPWTQADSSNRRLYGGSGLGLAITKSLVDMMGGKIGLNSECGVGSTFWVELVLPTVDPTLVDIDEPSSPDSGMKNIKFEFYEFQGSPLINPVTSGVKKESIVVVEPLDIPLPKPHSPKRTITTTSHNQKKAKLSKANKSKAPTSPFPSGKKFQVLLAEDNPINQAILVRFLEKMGCIEFKLTSDGVQALESYRQHQQGHFDVILLDQSMPKMDGDQVCREIRQNDPTQIIISVSANALLSDRTHFLEIGMNDHISKPVTFVNFRETLTKWLLIASSPRTKPEESDSTTIHPTTSLDV